ncbi:MAG: HigA family addiction module antitoxin [Gammaproteobacteria bacterium]|nr:HigA family addiction module antitoxin [Gammaproteobacteria bacterium]MDE0258935.1 HigA family addiction module antitoxin [Gammaproteobacteria bacterium]
MIRLPKNRPPTHPGLHVTRVIATHGLTQTRAARALGISFQRLNAVINERRGVTPDTALRLEKLFGVSAGFWLTSQLAWDLWHQMREESTISAVGRIEPVRADERQETPVGIR